MLMNFCDEVLLPQVECSTISTEGYEVTNLINKTGKGFLAYSSIRPPVHIDFTFICKVQISHVLIWPLVGAQKSSGFKLSVKSSADFEDVSTAFLKPTECGILFYRKDLKYSTISQPNTFLQRYIKVSKDTLVNNTTCLRISIIKTENSVPALNKIEIWGKVSSACDKNTKLIVESLWKKNDEKIASNIVQKISADNNDKNNERKSEDTRTIPEDFVDPITCEIMIRPIVLPCGKIIDQSTLEKHEKNEALWGRRLSDPFTGIPFSEDRKPIAAFALKERIDKYLLENCNVEEIKKMPRTLGTKHGRPLTLFVSSCSETSKKIPYPKINDLGKAECTSATGSCHKLPFCMPQPTKRKYINNKLYSESEKKLKMSFMKCDSNNTDINVNKPILLENNLEASIQEVLSQCKRLSEIENNESTNQPFTCKCCANKIFYKLPCQHMICRKVLLGNKNKKCTLCGTAYNSNDPVRTFS